MEYQLLTLVCVFLKNDNDISYIILYSILYYIMHNTQFLI